MKSAPSVFTCRLQPTLLFLLALAASSHSLSTTTLKWQEVSIDPNAPLPLNDDVSSSVGIRLYNGESILKLDHVVSPKDCLCIAASCTKAAVQLPATVPMDKPGLVRLPTVAAFQRAQSTKTPCADPLPSDVDVSLQNVLKRVMTSIDKELPPCIVTTLFHNGKKPLLDQHLHDDLKFSSREPAVNVYSEGGEFLAHKDAQSLTVLLPLSDKYEGGGTAFWSQDARGHRVEEPSIIVKPPAGTALLFGGCVTHAGMPVTKGTRVVYVASFSPKECNGEVGNTVQQRDIYGDSM